MYFDEFDGSAPVQSAARTISDADIQAFATLTGDHMPLHTDDAYAATTHYGRRIAHGALVFSVSVGLSTTLGLFDDSLLAFAGVDKVRFIAPVFPGDTVHVTKRPLERKALSATQGVVTFETRVLTQDGRLVCAYLDRLLLRRRPTPSEIPPTA